MRVLHCRGDIFLHKLKCLGKYISLVYECILEDMLGNEVKPPLWKHFHFAEVSGIKSCFSADLCAAVIELVVAAVSPARNSRLVLAPQVTYEPRTAGAYQLVGPHIC